MLRNLILWVDTNRKVPFMTLGLKSVRVIIPAP